MFMQIALYFFVSFIQYRIHFFTNYFTIQTWYQSCKLILNLSFLLLCLIMSNSNSSSTNNTHILITPTIPPQLYQYPHLLAMFFPENSTLEIILCGKYNSCHFSIIKISKVSLTVSKLSYHKH